MAESLRALAGIVGTPSVEKAKRNDLVAKDRQMVAYSSSDIAAVPEIYNIPYTKVCTCQKAFL